MAYVCCCPWGTLYIHGLTFLALRRGGLEVVNAHTSDKDWNRKLMKSNNTCNYYEHFDWWFFVLHKVIISDIERKRERGGVIHAMAPPPPLGVMNIDASQETKWLMFYLNQPYIYTSPISMKNIIKMCCQ